jgi:hypothetical protein
MKIAIAAGVVLGLLVAAWTLVMGYTGWYKDPQLSSAFFAVVLIQLGVLIVTLAKTRDARGYFGQVGVGLVASLVGAVIIFGSSMLFTTVLFPEYFEELRAMQEHLLREQGLDEGEVRAQLAAGAAMQTPFMQAFAGCVGTTVTGLVVSVIAALFLRKKAA